MTKYLSYLMQSGTQRCLPPGKGRSVNLNGSCNNFSWRKEAATTSLPIPRLNGLLCNFSSLLKERRLSQRTCRTLWRILLQKCRVVPTQEVTSSIEEPVAFQMKVPLQPAWWQTLFCCRGILLRKAWISHCEQKCKRCCSYYYSCRTVGWAC